MYAIRSYYALGGADDPGLGDRGDIRLQYRYDRHGVARLDTGGGDQDIALRDAHDHPRRRIAT